MLFNKIYYRDNLFPLVFDIIICAIMLAGLCWLIEKVYSTTIPTENKTAYLTKQIGFICVPFTLIIFFDYTVVFLSALFIILCFILYLVISKKLIGLNIKLGFKKAKLKIRFSVNIKDGIYNIPEIENKIISRLKSNKALLEDKKPTIKLISKKEEELIYEILIWYKAGFEEKGLSLLLNTINDNFDHKDVKILDID